MASDPGGVALELLSAPSPEQAMTCLVELGAETSGADGCALASIDDGTLRLEAVYPRGHGGDSIGRKWPVSAVIAEPLFGKALQEGRIVTGGSRSARDPTMWAVAGGDVATQSVAVVPLRRGGVVIALLTLSRHGKPFESGDLDRLQRIGGVALSAIATSPAGSGVNESQRRGLEALTTMSAHVASSDTPPLFFGKMSRSVASLASAAGTAFWLIDGDHLGIQPDPFGFEADGVFDVRVPLSVLRETGFDALFDHGDAFYQGKEATGAPHPIAMNTAHDFLAVPWKTATSRLGVLVAYGSSTGFFEQDEWIMRLAARASALVWQGYVAERRANELQAEEVIRLHEHATRVEDLERQKSDFLSLASHELRSPIGVVRGYLSMLQDGTFGELPGAVHRVLVTIEGRVELMNDLVDQTLDAARVERSRQLLSPGDFDVGEAVRDIVTEFDSSEEAQQRPIVVAGNPSVHVHADRRQVSIIIRNLISNALKYSPDGGEVTVAVQIDNRDVSVEVIDHGIGIDEQGLEGLFQPFARLGRSRTSGIEGIGIGLYLCRELARLQGGDITVRSEFGAGSAFTLLLPLAPEPVDA
ncbi:MAG: GAF domain-containing sensor histidine kinase [Candidatus Dormiibacterota bacterium]